MLLPFAMMLVLGAGPAAAAEAREARLDRGEILVNAVEVAGSNVPLSTVEAVIEAPPEDVWAIVADCGRYERTLPRILKSRLLERQDNVVTCHVVTDMPFPLSDLTSVTRGVETIVPGQRWSRAWTLVKGDYVTNTGGWELTAWRGDPARTHLRYRIRAEPKIAVPQALINAGQKSALPDLIEHIRKASAQKR